VDAADFVADAVTDDRGDDDRGRREAGLAAVGANPPRTAAVSPGRTKPTQEPVPGDDDEADREPSLLHRGRPPQDS